MNKRDKAISIAERIAEQEKDPDLEPDMVGDFTDNELKLYLIERGWWWDEVCGKWERDFIVNVNWVEVP